MESFAPPRADAVKRNDKTSHILGESENYVSNKGFVSGIRKARSKLNNEKKKQPNKEMRQKTGADISEKVAQMENQHIKEIKYR